MKRLFEYLSVLLVCASTIFLVGLQMRTFGWIILLIGIIFLKFCRKEFARDFLLLYLSIFILALTPLNPDIDFLHIFQMGLGIATAVALPYLISRYIFKNNLIKFNFKMKNADFAFKFAYLIFLSTATYFVVPFYLFTTQAYLNWHFEPGFSYLIKIFLALSIVGIWDELFFINTVLVILKKHLTFNIANLVQAIIFSAVLYDVGFKSWGFLVIFSLAFLQGYVFRKTGSLYFVAATHLVADFILFLALINAHYPNTLQIFVTNHF